MTKLCKNSLKKKGLSVLIVSVILISLSLQTGNVQSVATNGDLTQSTLNTPSVALNSVNSPIYGNGVNQTVRLYMENASSTTGINSINITAENSNDYLSQGQFNVTLDKAFNTTYTLEDDSPLFYPKSIYTPVETKTQGNKYFGTISGGTTADIISDNDQTFDIQSSNDGSNEKINLGVTTDFANVLEDDDPFNPLISNNSILGFKIDFKFKLLTADAKINLTDGNNLLQSFNLTNNVDFQTIEFNVYNENLQILNDTHNPSFNFVFYNATTSFTVNIDYVRIHGYGGAEVKISDSNSVALEFDLKGDSTVYGFQAWIRAFNTTATETSNLTIKLFNSNQTVPVKRSELLSLSNELMAEPNMTGVLLAENHYINFTGDSPQWFSFKNDFSGIDLSVGNYFIVISSDTTVSSEKSFTLVSIPNGAPDSKRCDQDTHIDHLLLDNSTSNWNRVYTDFIYEFGISGDRYCDAAAFSINLTRPYFPSEINAKISDSIVQNSYIFDYPHDESGYWASFWWGYGTANVNFNDQKAENGNFSISLSCDTDIYNGDLSGSVDFDVTKYYEDSSITQYQLTTDEIPAWNVTYSFDNNSVLFNNWIFKDMGFLIPQDWTITQMQLPSEEDIFGTNTTYNGDVDGDQYLEISKDVVNNTNGNYVLFANSPNYIHDFTLSLDYNGNEWETHGFMLGDNITGKCGVLEGTQYIHNAAQITATVYNSDDQPINTLQDSDIDENSTYSWYNFDSDIITNVALKGEYTIIANWTNGEEVGIIKQNFYVNNYDANILKVEYDSTSGYNEIYSSVQAFGTDTDNYNVYLYAVKPWTSTPDNFAINRTLDLSAGHEVYLTSFVQNETILNPDEDVAIYIQLENRHTTLNYDIKVEAQIVYSINNDLVIAEQSATKNLGISDSNSTDDTKDFNLTLHIPSKAEGGVNCPIREMPMVVKLSITIDSELSFTQVQNDYLYYSTLSDTIFDGKVLEMKSYENRIGQSFIANMAREDLELPGNITYFMQIANEFYQTLDTEANFTDFYKMDGQIQNFQISQSTFDHISTVNITGTAIDEYNNVLADTQINLYYDNTPENDTNDWKALTSNVGTSVLTDQNGEFNVEIDLSQAPIASKINLKAEFTGNSTFYMINATYEHSMPIYENAMSISIDSEITLIENKHNLIDVYVQNTGNSTLNNLSITIDSDFANQIIYMNAEDMDQLIVGETYHFQIDFKDNNFNSKEANLTISVNATVDQTNEAVSESQNVIFDVYGINTENLTTTIIIGAFVIGTVLVWLFSARYMQKKVKEINTPISTLSDVESKKKKRRFGKYVRVADLSTKSDKSGLETKPEEKKSVDLDDLLEENDK